MAAARTAAARTARGFTLVEALVALTILALIGVLSWRGVDAMVRAQQATQAQGDGTLALQAGLLQWQADLDAMATWPAREAAGPPAVQSLDWNGHVLRITRLAEIAGGSGLQVVAWVRRGGGAWQRWQSPLLWSTGAWNQAWLAAEAWGQGGQTAAGSVTIAHALDWQLHYFRDGAWTNPLSRNTAADARAQAQALPDAIRLLITLAPGEAVPGALVLDWIRPTFGGSS